MRTSDKKLSPVLFNQIFNIFILTLVDLKTSAEVKTFLTDFFTESELETFVKRLAISYWLKKGRSYTNIKQNLKVSSATIAEISQSINKKGVQLALSKIEAEEWANVWIERIKKFTKNK